MTKSRTQDPVKLLKRGVTVCVEAGHPDSVEEFQFRLIAKGGAELDCGSAHRDVEDFTFRAVFTPAAMARGDALLAVTQSNPYERTGDGQYHGDDRRRGYTFRKTTPPFLLSDRLAARVRERRQISLHFYDFLDGGRPQVLRFAKETSGAIRVGRKKIAVPVVQYGTRTPSWTWSRGASSSWGSRGATTTSTCASSESSERSPSTRSRTRVRLHAAAERSNLRLR